MKLLATVFASMLNQLGFAPFVEAERAEVTASVFWPGAPSGAWLDHIGGDFALRVEKGSLDSVECTRAGACWASGADGRVALLRGLS